MPKLGSFGTGSTKGSGLQGYTFPAPTGQFTQTLPGTYTWTAPANVKKVDIVMVGGGGGGGGAGRNSGGGGGASLTYANDVPVIPGTIYNYKVGAGGAVNTDGEASWFNNSTYLFANGGSKGTKTDSDATDQVTFTTSSTGITVQAVNGGNVVSDGTMGMHRQCTWSCPEGVFSISIVCVGAGGGGSPSAGAGQGTAGGSGGQGGTLSYKNNISVTPGIVYNLDIGIRTQAASLTAASFPSNGGLGGTMGGDTCFYDIIGLTVTQTAANGNITISNASRLVVNAAIMFAGTLGGIIPGKKYLITSVNTSTNIITVTDRWQGATLTWTLASTPTMSAVATSILASGGVGASGAGSNITLSGGGVRLGDGGGFGGVGGTTANSLSAGGGGAGGYNGNGGAGGSTAGSTVGAGPSRGAGGAAITSSGAAGGGSSGNMVTTIVNVTTNATTYPIGTTSITIGTTSILPAMKDGQVTSTANGLVIGTVTGNTSNTTFTITATTIQLTGSTNLTITYRTTRTASGGGGGVGLTGIGIDGVVTSIPPVTPSGAFLTYGGNPGSPATSPNGGAAATTLASTTSTGPDGGIYGAGGGGTTAINSPNYRGGLAADGALRIIYGVNRSFPSAAGTATPATYSTATAYAGGGGGGAAGYTSAGGAGGTALSGAAGGAGGVAFSGTIAGATIVSYAGGLGGIALVGNSAYSAATNPGGGAAAGGAGGIGPYGGGGVSYLGQSSVNSSNITTAAGASVLTGGTALTANNGGSNGSNGIGGAVNFASSTNGIAAAAAGGAGGGGGPGGAYGGKGGAGFFRIIWGPDRAYPNTLTMDLVQAGNFTSGVLYQIAKLGTTSQAQWNTLAGTSGSTYAVGTTFTPTSTITGSYGSGTAYRP